MLVTTELIRQAQSGNLEAQNQIVLENLAYIKDMVSKYPAVNQNYYDDLVQEGCIGLLKAIKKFDTNRKTDFLTYAGHWIRKYIFDGLFQSSNVHYPAQIILIYTKVHNFVTEYFKRMDDLPSEEEIIERTGISQEQLKVLKTLPSIQFYSSTAVNNNDDNEVTVLDNLVSDDNVQEWAVKESLKKDIHNILQTFDERTRYVITLAYGLEGENPHTYDEIGKSLNLTRQGVEYILKTAKKKIKDTPSMSNLLRTYLTA